MDGLNAEIFVDRLGVGTPVFRFIVLAGGLHFDEEGLSLTKIMTADGARVVHVCVESAWGIDFYPAASLMVEHTTHSGKDYWFWFVGKNACAWPTHTRSSRSYLTKLYGCDLSQLDKS